uniref:Innexin n=1 Tax=Panagrolaimus sp. ES5 TaxID=591445 RepID=A0AC34FCX2_9BILA
MDFQLPRHIFDRIDKLTSTTMPSYYVFMTVFICGYFGHQIHCFEKSDWVSSWIEYATDYCFVHGTYFVKTNETYSAEVIRQMIPYQYLPFVFAAMGIFLTIPAQMFYFADFCSGTKFDQLLMSGENLNFEKFLNRVSKRTRENAFSGSLMLFFYTFYKVSNILIICIQLCIAPVIMTQQNGYFEAFNTVKTIIYGPDWKESGIFPRVTTNKKSSMCITNKWSD